MAQIEGFRVRNFRALKDVTLGKLWNQQRAPALTPMTAVIGKNGVGKSTLFDAFGFLADVLRSGVEEACDLRGRGGSREFEPGAKPSRSSLKSITKKIRAPGQLPMNCR
jgi:AAA15 family ATPase/GTPase